MASENYPEMAGGAQVKTFGTIAAIVICIAVAVIYSILIYGALFGGV
jgi:hypothetical protein